MAVRRSSNQRTIHLIYNEEYGIDPEFIDHLPDLRVPMESLGYQVQEYFVSPANIRQQVADIPRDDPYHIVFMHIDMPQKVPLGTRLETARFIESEFKFVTGHHSDISEHCVWKSVMNEHFDRYNVKRVPSIRVETVEYLGSKNFAKKLIQSKMHLPLFIKVDDGFNSLGLSNASVIHSMDDLMQEGGEMISKYGPILVQPYISGREFTVAVTANRAYHPVERIFAPGELVSQPGGTARECLLDVSEVKRIETIQREALGAFRAVNGLAYGRVDLREDPKTGEIYVLEVNSTCSLRPNSYFQQSVEFCGSSIKKIIRDILRHAGTGSA